MSDTLLPQRFTRPNLLGFVLTTLVMALVVSSFYTSGLSLEKLIKGLPSLARLGTQMFPPSTERLLPVFWSLLQTFQMAIAGTVLGLIFSLPLAILAAPFFHHPAIVWALRSLMPSSALFPIRLGYRIRIPVVLGPLRVCLRSL